MLLAAATGAAALLVLPGTASAVNIVQAYQSGWDPSEDSNGSRLTTIVNHVVSVYEDVFQDAFTLNLTYRYDANMGQALGQCEFTGTSGSRVTSAILHINRDFPWYWDGTPATNDEYQMHQTLWRDLTPTERSNGFTLSGSALPTFEAGYWGDRNPATHPLGVANHYDLLSVVFHEVGHALGVSNLPAAEIADNDYDYTPSWVGNKTLAAKTTGTFNDHIRDDYALMFPGATLNARILPSHADLLAMAKGSNWTSLDLPRREFYGGSTWNTANAWTANVVPSSDDDAFIRSGLSPSVTAAAFARNLFVGEGSVLSISNSTLTITGGATVDCTGAILGATQISVGSNGIVSATTTRAGVYAINGGVVNLTSSTARVNAFYLVTDPSGNMSGIGTLNISNAAGELTNNGTLAGTSGGTLTITGSGAINLDGQTPAATEPGIVRAVDGNVHVVPALSDEFNGTIYLGNGSAARTLTFDQPWTMAGTLNVNGGATGCTIAGGTAAMNGNINVTGLVIVTAPSTYSSTTHMVIGGDYSIENTATLAGGSYTGAGSIGFDSITTVTANTTINTALVNLDGSGSGSTININSGVTLTLTGELTDSFSSVMNVNGGTFNIPGGWNVRGDFSGSVNVTGGTISGGTMGILSDATLNLSGAIISAPLALDGKLNNSGTSQISGASSFDPGSSTVIAGVLQLDNANLNGGSITGGGRLLNGGVINAIANTTISCFRFDFDGSGSVVGTTNVMPGVTLTSLASQLDNGNDIFDGFLNLDGGTFFVNNAANSWSLTAQIDLKQNGANIPAIAGEQLQVSGGLLHSISGSTQITAPLLFNSGTAQVDAGTMSVTGLFTLANSGTMSKTGAGTLAINGAQSHGFNAIMHIGGGTVSFNSDAGSIASRNLTANVNAGTLSMNVTQHVAAVNVAAGATAALTPGGNKVLRATSIAVTGSGRLNIGDGKVITNTALGSWNGSAYTGVIGLVASGRNGDATPLWDGGGIVTSQSLATGGNLHSIGIARASDVRPETSTTTVSWGGEMVSASDTLVMYTYGGDANLDGKINILDYVRIDSGIVGGLTGWSNGDFNYDGKVNIIDYASVIDANIGIQNGFVFSTAGGVENVVAVPEPGWLSLMVSVAAIRPLRRCRRRG